MIRWMKTNMEMTLTIISGILIVLGFILDRIGNHPLAMGTFILAFLIGGYFSAKSAWQELVHDRHLSVDVLMILAAIGAAIVGYWAEGALLIFIFSLAESLEVMAMAKSRQAIEALMSLTPDVALKYQADGSIVEVATSDLLIGDTIQVRKGEAVPIDGKLLSDHAVINEASITGEPIPATKYRHDEVIGATINEENSFDMEVTTENDNTLFSKIIKMVETAQNNPSKVDSFIQGIEDNYVKIVLIAVPLFILVAPYIFGWSWGYAFYRGMVLLTVVSPCALVASAAPTNLSAISRAAKNDIIVKGADTLEQLSDIQAVVFDKTGTLTIGKPQVDQAEFIDNGYRDAAIDVLVSAESKSSHPIAQAIVQHFEKRDTLGHLLVNDVTGKGLEVIDNRLKWFIGSKQFISESLKTPIPQDILDHCDQLQSQGATVIYISREFEYMGYVALKDALKTESVQAIQELHQHGIHTVMLTGDQAQTAQTIAQEIGIDEFRANLMPQDKVSHIQDLQDKYGVIAMVGDGINDAPALATANIGISMGSGTDIAMETSDVVLIKDDLKQLGFVYGLSQKMRKITKQNIIFSLSIIVILIISNLMETINLPIGVIGHEGSTILVILNGLRMLAYRK